MNSKIRPLQMALIALLLAVSTIQHVTSQDPAPTYCDRLNTATKPNPVIFRPNPPRVYPFCIGKDPETGKWDDTLERSGFASIIDEINRIRNEPGQTPAYAGFHYKKDDHLFDDPTQTPPVTNPPTMTLHVHVLNIHLEKSQVFMENWLLLEFLGMFQTRKHETKPIRGVYIQGIQGPLGIPFGEFIMHDNYGTALYEEDIADSIPQDTPPPDWMKISKAYPCTFYSKAGPMIPNVFLFSSKLNAGRDLRGRVRVRALFRWDDPVCAEVAFMQFLVIIVYEWGNQQAGHSPEYRVGVSPVVLPGQLSFSPTGLAHPYYPDWDKKHLLTYRTSTVARAVEWSTTFDTHRQERIVSNFDYEACIQHQVGLVKSGPNKGACPPGPFKCSATTIAKRPATRKELSKWKIQLWRKWNNFYLAFKPARPACSPIPSTTSTTEHSTISTSPNPDTSTTPIAPPSTTATTTPLPVNPLQQNEDVIAVVAEKVEERKVISHGDLCVMIWFVLVPVANFLARYFKDFPNWSALGIGFWIASHVILHNIGALLMWISFGLVVSNGVTFLGGGTLSHYLYGFPATFIQHWELFVGFVRDQKPQTALRQSYFHVINAFVAGFLSLLCCVSSRLHPHKLYIVIALYITDMLAYLLGNSLEWKISKKLGFFPARKYFPVLERVIMVNKKPFLFKLKIFMACVYILLIVLLYSTYFLYDDYIAKKRR